MKYKAIIFGTDDLYDKIKPCYNQQVKDNHLEIVDTMDAQTTSLKGYNKVDFVIISSTRHFYERIKQLESFGIPRKKIIDGRVFQTADFNLARFVEEGIAYGSLDRAAFKDKSRCIYPRIFSDEQVTLKLGEKSVIGGLKIRVRSDSVKSTRPRREASISVEKFCAIANGIYFYMTQTKGHNHKTVTNYALTQADWQVPKNFLLPDGICKINIGNDVWIGSNCILKSINPKKPLVIGDGAIIATDSVVVKNVPPYAIVGGNPAQIISYRFPPDVIESLLRIKWWDWSIDKIHDNFKYFNNIDKFISLHDK